MSSLNFKIGVLMQSLYADVRSYLTLVRQPLKHPMFLKFGLFTFELVGSITFLYTIVAFFGSIQSIVTMIVGAGYGVVRIIIAYRKGMAESRLKDEMAERSHIENEHLRWQNEQLRKAVK